MARMQLNLGQKQSLVTSLSAAIAAFLIIILITLSTFIFIRGGHYFWPQDIQKLTYTSSQVESESTIYAIPTATTVRVDQALLHYRYSSSSQLFNGQITLTQDRVLASESAKNVATVLLKNGGLVIAQLISLKDEMGDVVDIENFQFMQLAAESFREQIEYIRNNELAYIHNQLADMDRKDVDLDAPAREKLSLRFYELQDNISVLESKLNKYTMTVQLADGAKHNLNVDQIVSISEPNQLGYLGKISAAFGSFWLFVTDAPKLDNTSGGVYPALFGTIVMVLLMTIIVTPIGALAALYLYEYAPQNKTTALIRISVNNLAGVPSIVYGVFGLGFFVYTVGGNIDQLLFSDELPSPTFGAPGLFWASLTMAILTLPVVIVATEEGLRRVPKSLRDGSYALGATQAETVFKMVLPIASPGIMTGVILAIARGAGEVAPLMLLGAVKFAPALPIDGEFPFFHLQRQFMHLGVLIYDGAFHSQNIGNGSSFVFACCMLLLLIVLVLNLFAILIRNRLRRHYSQN